MQRVLGDNPVSFNLAKDILDAIYQKYDGYSWFIQVKGGYVFIRETNFPSAWGMGRRLTEIDFSSSNLKKKVVESAGEWLEQARLRRGSAEKDFGPYRVEGIPESDQPLEERPRIIVDPSIPLREEVRPQVLRG